MAKYFEVHPENPQPRLLKQAVGLLERGEASAAELHAAALDGDLVPVGLGWLPADAIETPGVRAASLRPALGDALADTQPDVVTLTREPTRRRPPAHRWWASPAPDGTTGLLRPPTIWTSATGHVP